ncbi:c2H2-type domain-containing protein [Trichonephila clavipes]|nr:c2H2-type domain-containing protein [Trichonephila clavipes]
MLSRENLSRIHLTTRQDIKNIKRSFGLTNQRHADDATSVRLMLEEMAEFGTDNPILGCKFQGCLLSEYEGLNNEDFFLALQHPLQKEMLKKFGEEIVCVDSTHGTNSYNFKLITVLVVDDFGEGFPVAWCISNREDFTVLRKFFLLIKNNTDTSITSNFFMSDDAPAFYNAWSDVFDFPVQKILCYFHFDKSIRSKIETLIKNKLKACEVYKAITILFSETNEQIFRKMFVKFLNNLKEDTDTDKFYHYFLNNYNNREKEIAMCFRNACKIRTNNHLESFHKDFKYNYLSGKVNKRLDFCIYKLMEFVKDKGCKRIIKLERGKITSKKKIN